MRLFRLLLIIMFTLSALPVTGFCHDDDCGSEEVQHCAMAGHTCCAHTPTLVSEHIEMTPPSDLSFITRTVLNTYQDPHLTVQHPPPIVLS